MVYRESLCHTGNLPVLLWGAWRGTGKSMVVVIGAAHQIFIDGLSHIVGLLSLLCGSWVQQTTCVGQRIVRCALVG